MSGTVQDWLRTKNVAIWPPQQWDLTDDEERAEAGAWFERETGRSFVWRFSDSPSVEAAANQLEAEVLRVGQLEYVVGSVESWPAPAPETLQPFTGFKCVCRDAGRNSCHTGHRWHEHRQEMLKAVEWAVENRKDAA